MGAGRTGTPLIVAHRALWDGPDGSRRSGRPTENTVTAVQAAAAAGAGAVELDVRRTRDGQLVLAHDAVQWDRYHGLPVPRSVRWSTRRTLNFLGTLAQVLPAALAADVDVRLDIKDTTALLDVAAWCLRSGLDLARIGLWVRTPASIADLRGKRAFAEVALLSDERDAGTYIATAARSEADAVSLNPDVLDAGAVAAAHDAGLRVYAWIQSIDGHANAVGLGVDGLVTDWVRAAVESS